MKNETTAGEPKRASDEGILHFCDGYFASMMEDSLTDEARLKHGLAQKPVAPLSERERYLKAHQAGKQNVGRAIRRKMERKLFPERGLGPRVFIGFDAEWTRARKGRNRILSVQFYLVGPTGEVFTMVIPVVNGEIVSQRPRLAEVINDLLESAMDAGVITERPVEVVLCGFFTRADITIFSDFKHLRPQLEGVGGTLVTVSRPAKIELPISPDRRAALKHRYQAVVGDEFEPHLLNVHLIDASRLAPPGKSLVHLGNWLGIPKHDLPAGYDKADMARFQRERPEEYEAYGLRDAEIAVMFVLWVTWFASRHLGMDMRHLSATASGLAVRIGEACIRRDGVALDVALNYEVKQLTRWDNTTGVGYTQKKRVPKRIRKWLEPFLADVFIGGHNQCFTYGPTERRRFYDPDLSGAYLSALAYLYTLDYDEVFWSKDVADFIGHVAGFALVEFSFPDEVKYPCLPVSTEDRGLLFPRRGESLCTAPEIELAVAMGAKVVIKHGIVIPWMKREDVFARSSETPGKHRPKKKATSPAEECDDTQVGQTEQQHPRIISDDEGYRLFESYAVFIRVTRDPFARKTLPFEFVKLLGCSLYGKTGQGFKRKRAWGVREMGSVIVGTSRISEAAIAALVCGFIRAVIAEILWRLPAGTTVVSATTDGFLVDCPIEQLDLTGVMCRRFQDLVDRVSPESHMLENKHQVMQLFAGRTRLQFTVEADGDHKTVTAKGGIKPGPEVEDENAFMLDLTINRQPGQKITYESFISMRDQLPLELDLQTETRETRINLEYDFKRRPIPASVRMVEMAGTDQSHLAFDTEPWGTVDEALMTRLIFDAWRDNHCLKTVEDFQSWEYYRAFKMATLKGAKPASPTHNGNGQRTGRKNLTRGGYLAVAKQLFLAAYQKRQWGLDGADLSQRKLAEWLTSEGYKTSVSAVKNGTREHPVEHVVPATAEVVTFLEKMRARFPSLEVERFLTESS
ncbi:hypothetical protein [Propionivibrio sp.]|uniref:hypothetical protein n=1 Tax=Propionivibrio sp. TaxID=2212460 RepID=UPI0026221EA3|nr:hypothetical protein [Propionivibrio sp.]